VTVLLNHLSKL